MINGRKLSKRYEILQQLNKIYPGKFFEHLFRFIGNPKFSINKLINEVYDIAYEQVLKPINIWFETEKTALCLHPVDFHLPL